MEKIKKIKFISIFIFIIPFSAVNACLILITQFPQVFPNQEDIILNTFPYIDGGASISRTARPYPSWLIFKPAMYVTSFLLIKYWIYNRDIIKSLDKNHKNLNKIIFFGVGSAIALAIHATFLGIKFDHDLYKLFRRIIMLAFIVFELVAQAYLVSTFYSLKGLILKFINEKYLKLKRILVITLIIVAIISLPLVSMPGNKFLKHALEWDYFLGVITFYVLTFLMWKKND
jgi:hypothetical protein